MKMKTSQLKGGTVQMALCAQKKTNICAVAALLFQVLFLTAVFVFSDVLVLGPTIFRRKMSYEEWGHLLQQGEYAGNQELLMLFMVAEGFVLLMDVMGLYQILFSKSGRLPIRAVWKVLIPVFGLLGYLPFYFHFKYQAEYFRLYMSLAPVEMVTLVFLVLLCLGRRALHRQTTA